MKRGQIKERISYYIENGVTDYNSIIGKLRAEFPEEQFKENSIKSYISILRPTKNKQIKTDNQNSNDSLNSHDNNNSNNSINNSNFDNSINSSENQNIQTEETFETQTSNNEITIKNKTDLPLITANNKFVANASEQQTLPEAPSIAESYTNQKIDEVIDEKQLKQTKIHIDRFGEIAGDGAQVIFNSKAFQKLSHGYKLEDKEVKRINEDMSIVLQQRVPSVFSDYGDLINLGGDFARIMIKGLAHRLKSPLPEEFKNKVRESEKNIESVVNEVVKQMKPQEVSIESESVKNINACKDCSNESMQDLDENGRCPNCHFNYRVQELNKQNSGV